MRVGIDVDGCLADFNEAFIRRIVKMTGRDLFGPGYEPTTWNYPESVGYTTGEVDAIWQAIRTDRVFWYTLNAYPETSQAMVYLSERILGGDDVYFITARPGRDAKKQTEMWLQKEFSYILFQPVTPTVLISSHKGLCAQALGLDVYIDDRWENCLEAAAMHWKGEQPKCRTFLLDRPWNREFSDPNITRVSAIPGICDPVPDFVPTPRSNTSPTPAE